MDFEFIDPDLRAADHAGANYGESASGSAGHAEVGPEDRGNAFSASGVQESRSRVKIMLG